MAGAKRRRCGRLITYRLKCLDPVGAVRLVREGCARFRDDYRQRRNVSAVMRRTPTVIIRISVAPKSLIVCKGTSQSAPDLPRC
jgi:hypothetical protein